MRESVRTILSGPAGGAVGALALGAAAGFSKIITFDMGGTSTDVALIDGCLPLTMESGIEGYPVKVPMIDIHTVGAGGGSIARLDEGGALRVGPESAGRITSYNVCYTKLLRMILENPAAAPRASAPTAPPAGPERMVRTDSRMAVSAEMEPPLDCMMRRLPSCRAFCREAR